MIRADLCERSDPNRNDIKAYYHFINIFIYLSIINHLSVCRVGRTATFFIGAFAP